MQRRCCAISRLKHFATLPFFLAIYIRIAFYYCYVITFYCGANMSASLFSLSALTRLLMAIALVLFIGLAVRWAVALP
ncbi:hypothetical protein CEP66_12955 [Citrobacter koseri]|uniref:Uncharacterized protein n=1 Tax=Citrobacter koseri TaxID=545 RepID=A0AAQ1A4C2_CITKO|nr:hypothetical protein CEP66_12955 [Citrobacter koseri]ATF98705.1 hypothetical protein CO700_17490 [Citrobacter koseri]AVE69962.1 hypothetical protein AM351_20200 [Citrobacter koseri]PNN12668.1 hypothetical protein AL526_008085 [Citrobacter koseri]RSC16963.1 hypothetical protein EGS84_08400 [Citrobacter koseri]